MKNELTYTLITKDKVKELDIDRMFYLMDESYDHVTRKVFEKDLFAKDYVGIMTHDGVIHGFTTYAVNPHNSGTDTYNILFSGDTIISPDYWGSQILLESWSRTVGTLLSKDPDKKWYWYLLSKGHRTYMYLPLFFADYYPSPFETKDESFKVIADKCSTLFYGDQYIREKGVVKFVENLGALKKELIEATYKKKKSTFASFFLEKNPEFYKGDELVCVSEISRENMIRNARRCVIDGIENPLI